MFFRSCGTRPTTMKPCSPMPHKWGQFDMRSVMRVKAVCAYVDLGFQPLAEQGSCLPAEKFRSYAAQMGEAIGHKNLRFFDHYPFAECWAVREFFPRIMRPNCPTAPDR